MYGFSILRAPDDSIFSQVFNKFIYQIGPSALFVVVDELKIDSLKQGTSKYNSQHGKLQLLFFFSLNFHIQISQADKPAIDCLTCPWFCKSIKQVSKKYYVFFLAIKNVLSSTKLNAEPLHEVKSYLVDSRFNSQITKKITAD